MAEPTAFKYRAFISYSHADTSWAKWLHRALEGFRIDKDLIGRDTTAGTIPKALRPIFRDRDDFTAGHSLTDQTMAALDASAGLVVICSPAAAKSQYVNEEVRLFKLRHPERPVVPLIVDGKPGDPDRECFPPALRFKLDAQGGITEAPVELLAADAREEGDGKTLAIAKVVAGLLGVSPDDIFRRAERERRRKGRVRNAIVASIVLLAVAGGYAFWDAARKGETIVQHEREKTEALAIASKLLGANPAAAAVPGQEQSLVAALSAIQESAAQGDTGYAKALDLLKQGKGVEAVPMLLAAAEEKKGRATRESKDAAKAYRAAAAVSAVAEPWRARELFAEAARLDPDHVGGMQLGGWFQQEAGQLAAAEAAYRRVLEVGRPGVDDLSLYWSRLGIGDILSARGALSGALAEYRAAGEIAGRIVEADSGNAKWQRNRSVTYERIGDVLRAQGDLEAALKAQQISLAIRDRLAEADPDETTWQSDLAIAYAKVGDILRTRGKLDAALNAFRRSVAIAERLNKADAGSVVWQRDLATFRDNVADVLMAQDKLAEALENYQDSLAIRLRLAEADPANAKWRRDLAVSYESIGDVLAAQGNLEMALQAYQGVFAITDQLAKADPGNAGAQRDLAVTYGKIGRVLRAQGSLGEALKAHRADLAIAESLAKTDPSNVVWQRDLALSHGRIGEVLDRQHEREEALGEYRKARAIIVRLKAQSPDNAALSDDLARFEAEIAKLEQAGATAAAP
jgi:tetratricopeptide (TPR) repeat protein